MHANLVGTSGLRLDRFGVDVLEELKATVTVWRLEHRDVGVIAIKADGSVGPLTTDRVTGDAREGEVGEKGDRCLEVANGMPTFSSLMAMRCMLPSRVDHVLPART